MKVDPCVASPRPLGYRNRSKLVVARREEGRPDDGLVLGAFAPRSHDVVDLAGCRIAEPPLDETAAALRALLDEAGVRAYHERTLTGDLRHVVLRANHEGRVLAVWIVARPLPRRRSRWPDGFARPDPRSSASSSTRTARAATRSSRTRTGENERLLDGAGEIEDQVEVAGRPVRLLLSPGAFFQANREVAALAYTAIADALAIQPTERVVDAYCGVGGIALSLARGAAEVLGIESHAGAVAGATASAALNGITNARFVAGDAAQALGQIDRADVVVLNPPRKGCAPEVLAEIARLAPRAVAYLSCDPQTLARDLALLATRGYRARSVTPFDMLPHTPHVEALAVVDRLFDDR